MRLGIIKTLMLIFWQICGTMIIIFVCRGKANKEIYNHTKQNDIDFMNFAEKIQILLLPISVFYFYTMMFMRLCRSMFIINYIAIGIVISQRNRKKLGILIMVYIGYIIATFLFFNIISGDIYEHIFFPIFENNIIFQLFRGGS